MQNVIESTPKGHTGRDRMERLIEKGNRLHDQAVVDFFRQWVPAVLLSMTGGAAKNPETKSAGPPHRRPLKHSPQVPA